ncbi:MAG: glycosyltransferase family 39 protein [Gammaproteobacteria bacterium]|nr:glycosyltransferase family 39 protein [Gammaproteobacteria bacterium]
MVSDIAGRRVVPGLPWSVRVALATWAVLWIGLPVGFDLVPPSDNIEQLVWSQGLELGYHKHPPMPTWILIAAGKVLPVSVPLTFVLAILGIAIGWYFLWRLATELLGRDGGLAAVLATACIAFYAHRGHIFNHNTVLVPFCYAAAWYFLRGVRFGRLRDWILLGVAAAGALLTKYQFGLLVVCFALIGVWLRLYTRPEVVRGVLIAAGTTLVLLLPHIGWLFARDFPPFRYASEMIFAHLTYLQRLSVTGGFVLQEMRDALVPVAMLLLAGYVSHRLARGAGAAAGEAHPGTPQADDAVWIWTLGVVPFLLLLVLGLAGGVRLENHWGTAAMQFIALPIISVLTSRGVVLRLAGVLVAFFATQGAAALRYVVDSSLDNRASLDGGRLRAFDPAALSHAVLADWHRTTSEPLRYIVGPTVISGMVSVYSEDHPQVLIRGQPRASPWVSLERLQSCGAVYISPLAPAYPGTVALEGNWTAVGYRRPSRGKPLRIEWIVVPPDTRCGGPRPPGPHWALPAVGLPGSAPRAK